MGGGRDPGGGRGSEGGDSAVTRVEMSLRQPEVAKVGRNRFKVVVEDAAGQPLQDAEVWLTLYRRGVPGSKGYIEYPVQTKVELEPGEQAGVYEAIGPIVASGLWDVKMQVKPRGAGSKKISTTTKNLGGRLARSRYDGDDGQRSSRPADYM